MAQRAANRARRLAERQAEEVSPQFRADKIKKEIGASVPASMKGRQNGSYGYAAMSDHERAQRIQLKKEFRIPGDTAIKRLPDSERRLAEDALRAVDGFVSRELVRARNAYVISEYEQRMADPSIPQEVKDVLKADLGETARKLADLDRVQAREDRMYLDRKTAPWRVVAGQVNGPLDANPPASLTEGLDLADATSVRFMAEYIGIEAAKRLAAELRKAKR